MANELRIADLTGKTYTCEVRAVDGTLITTAISLAENGSTGSYYGDFPSGSASSGTIYDLIYIESSVIKGTETKFWNGTKLLGFEDLTTATGFSTFDASTDEVITDSASRTASQADVSELPTAAALWSAPERTLTNVQNNAIQSNVGNRLTVTCGVTFDDTISGLTIPANWIGMVFTVKDCPDNQEDSQSILQILESNPADGDDGIQVLNSATSALVGTLTTNQVAGTVDIDISNTATRALTPRTQASYDLKVLLDDGTNQLLVRDGYLTVKSTPSKDN